MRLFVVDSMPLDDLAGLPHGPQPGDVVTFWRDAQDIDGTAAERLRERGIGVEWAEGRIDQNDIDEIDAFADHFGRNWHLRNGQDVTRSDDFSYGDSITRELHGRAKIGFLVRYGRIYEKLFAAYPNATEIVTDFVDGSNWLSGNAPSRFEFQRRQLLYDLARARGIAFRDLKVETPLPPLGFHGRAPLYRAMVVSLLGGLRPRYLLGRLKMRFSKKTSPRIYMLMTPGLAKVAKAVAQRGGVECLGDWAGYPGVTPLRFDQLVALPSGRCLKAVWNLHRIIGAIQKAGFGRGLATLGSLDYAPYFLTSIKHLARYGSLRAMIAAAQARKMLRICRPDVVVINGEGSIMSRLMVGLDRRFGYRVAFIDHSHTMVNYGHHPCGRNFPNVTYIIQGTDHVECYGRKLPADNKPDRPVLTNPNPIALEEIRGRQPNPPAKRILLTNYSPGATASIARIPFEDRYIIEIFEAARRLIPHGYRFTYRPHPGYNNPAYIHYMLGKTGLADHIELDRAKTLADSLVTHDLLVSNVSGCLYQALYAGWPTIFYEPDFKPHQFVGLLGATDFERPIAATPDALVRMVLDGVENPDSLTARFPALFTSVYTERFIGRDASRADQVLADFLVDHCTAREAGQPGVAPRPLAAGPDAEPA